MLFKCLVKLQIQNAYLDVKWIAWLTVPKNGVVPVMIA